MLEGEVNASQMISGVCRGSRKLALSLPLEAAVHVGTVSWGTRWREN